MTAGHEPPFFRLLAGRRSGKHLKFQPYENENIVCLPRQYLPFSGRRGHHAPHRGATRPVRDVRDRLRGNLRGTPRRTARSAHAQRGLAPRLCADAPFAAGPGGGFRPLRHDRGDGRHELRVAQPAGSLARGCAEDFPHGGVLPPPSRPHLRGSFSAAIPAGIMFPIPITKGPRASSWCSTCWKTAARGFWNISPKTENEKSPFDEGDPEGLSE
mgnify:CR=1 FL=1